MWLTTIGPVKNTVASTLSGTTIETMPRFCSKALTRFRRKTDRSRMGQPHKHTIPVYVAKIQYVKPEDTLPKLLPRDKLFISGNKCRILLRTGSECHRAYGIQCDSIKTSGANRRNNNRNAAVS